ncbi:hypothetical protein GEV33_004956 [Tenebrio molitor]|uniref:Uncharacterized protein n=1 Tax=Tenebrio molitor TaxID=7067 RepID=A0A8J6LE49_TENMO|nr:hypothetical protein GEV33_004956 [Tenebrio molitor]
MHQDKFNVNFIKLIASYLKDRQLKVKINNTVSTEKSIESGVPQGSILAIEEEDKQQGLPRTEDEDKNVSKNAEGRQGLPRVGDEGDDIRMKW